MVAGSLSGNLATERRGIYVSSVSGNDANSGRTPGAPFETLSAAIAVATSIDTIYLSRGSTFLEELTGLPEGIHVRAYGSGARPIVDGRETADNGDFSKTAGQTNVYQISWAHAFAYDGGLGAHRVWEDGTMLARVASVAACDATAGTFYAGNPTTGGPDLVYVHPNGSTDPTTDGKEYKLTYRRWCVSLRDSDNHANVREVYAIGNAHNAGSLVVDGYLGDSVAVDGRVHNVFIRGTCEDVTALRCEIPISGSATMFITHQDGIAGGTDGRHTVYRRCVADLDQVSTAAITGFYVHSDNGVEWGTVQYEDCDVQGCLEGYSGIQADTFLYYRCTYTGVTYAHRAVGSTRSVILGGTGELSSTVNGLFLSYNTGATVQLIAHGHKVYSPGGGIGPISVALAAGDVTITRNTIEAPSGLVGWLKSADACVFDRNIITGTNLQCVRIGTTTAQINDYQADENCYYRRPLGNAVFRDENGAVDYTTIADWRTALAGLSFGPETSSVVLDPQLTDPANGDFTVGNATVVALGAGAEVDETDDSELQAYWSLYRVA